MTRESTARLWNALLAVHVNLTRDLVDKLNHATEVTDDDIQPLLERSACFGTSSSVSTTES
jgi:hypothetical protein